ncbi:Mrx21p Ecym_7278 [Eremothecium cymbalariae DBVPG|uniref:Mitochondrial carrier protein n=1 Tax=Eremothecium cymbalariae (strain CBS 270.75 / DBVPG 7215 / KCTC 17166 / NRRL Y-17582) TaxID=931890 RepID=G8JWA5_ERECY|nr:hypothetical protein Ecym_7278 [Eremothecium cymbalariae DBVPG\
MSTATSIKDLVKQNVNVAFVAGGMGGALSRTVVSPFERVKILLQVQHSTTAYNQSVLGAVKQIYKEEGVRGLFRGNGLNCLRVFPYTAVQYTVYEFFKKRVFDVHKAGSRQQLDNWERLLSGAVCGGTSVVATYPLDLVRTRLSIQTANLTKLNASKAKNLKNPPGIVQLLIRTYKEEGGIAAWYRGLYPTSLGVVPFVALNFALYEFMKGRIPSDIDPHCANAFKLSIGAVSGGIAQTLIYPFDLLRRRFQVLAMGGSELGFKYKSVADALITIGKTEGVKGYYKGLTANLFKVIPATAVQWCVYEVVSDFLNSYN